MGELSVEIAFALTDDQTLRTMSVPSGSTVADVIAASGLAERYPQHNPGDLQAGIWGCVADPGQVVKDGDRVEIYRPLKMDPRQARRKLADAGRTMNGKRSD